MSSLLSWLSSTVAGELLYTALVSMIPVLELRGAIPFGVALGLPIPWALAAAVVGNLLPVPFIIIYFRRILAFARRAFPRFDGLLDALERKIHLKGQTVSRYKVLGLCVLVAIPLPGTGAWTGAMVAAFLDMRLKNALPSIALGVLIAGVLVSLLTFGVAWAVA